MIYYRIIYFICNISLRKLVSANHRNNNKYESYIKHKLASLFSSKKERHNNSTQSTQIIC